MGRVKFADREDLTPVNAETFGVWLEKKNEEKRLAAEEKTKAKLKKKGGKKGLTGRELFSLTPNIFKDDENASEKIEFEKDDKEEEEKKKDTQSAAADDKGKGKGKKKDVAVVEDVGDASLFLDMGDMLDEMEIID